ncbi:MAG: tetratricopeptide repeat protein [Chitinophagaceae bacterium]
MKKGTIYTIVLFLFAGAIAFIIFKYKKDEKGKADMVYELQPRTGPGSRLGDWQTTQTSATEYLNAIKANPTDNKSRLKLAAVFIQEARVTGNYMYYDKAAMKYLNDVLALDSNNFEGLTYKALINLSQHHFADGLAVAKKAQAINPYNAFIYGLMVDGNVEMGHYDTAISYSDKMMSIRPDIRSYSRVSYIREIHGDYPGAIEAMKLAVESGVPGEEGTEWARVQLGHLYENSGDMKAAEMHYTIALQNRPDYAYALAGLARIATAGKDYKKAINLYLTADTLVTDYSFQEELMDLYKQTGETAKAEEAGKNVIAVLMKHAQAGINDATAGHYADRELSYAYLKMGNYDKALEHALTEYNRRPDNIDVNETVAWAYYNKGDYAKALPYIKTALKTNSKNPTLLCRAALILSKNGDTANAKSYLTEALKNNPNIAADLRMQVQPIM